MSDHSSIIHACPPKGSGVTPCCNKTPFELPTLDRLTEDTEHVTCHFWQRIADLERENAEAHKAVDALEANRREWLEAYGKLERKNAELKASLNNESAILEQVAKQENEIACDADTLAAKIERLERELQDLKKELQSERGKRERAEAELQKLKMDADAPCNCPKSAPHDYDCPALEHFANRDKEQKET